MGRLESKVAVITGAGRGIGRGIALMMAEEGAKVVVNDAGVGADGSGFEHGPADQVVAEIKEKGGTAVATYGSVAIMEGGERIIQTALDTFGRLDILVNVAGILRDRMIFNMTEAEWDAVIAVHLKGHFACTKPASIIMREQRYGRIINFSSESGLTGNAGQANYGAAKAGIAGFTRVVARDLGRYGITVNCISPRAWTRMTANLPERSLGSGISPAEAPTSEQIRQMDPDDVAPMVCYLASDGAWNINGQIFRVYGETVALLEHPLPWRTIFKPGMRTQRDLSAMVPRLMEGVDNPAPPPDDLEVPQRPEPQSRPIGQSKKRRGGDRLKGRSAVVTGAGRGIGHAVAMALAAEGANVLVNDPGVNVDGTSFDQGPAEQVAAEISSQGGNAVANYDSVATYEGGERIVQACLDAFGRIDILVNVAGILRDRMIFNMTEAEWDAVIAVHLKGHFNTVRPTSVLMRQQRFGRIINFSSISGLLGNAGQANYGAAKAGIAGFTRVVARDLGRYGITVNCIAPGAATRLTASIPQGTAAPRTQRGSAEPSTTFSLPGEATPEHVAPMVIYLCSDEAWSINGQIFHVAGGGVSLASPENPYRKIMADGRWTVDGLASVVPSHLLLGIVNPAPPSQELEIPGRP